MSKREEAHRTALEALIQALKRNDAGMISAVAQALEALKR